MESDKILDIYYDHYKESNTLNNAVQSRRNRGFIFLCILEAISFMMTRNPEFICGLLNDAIAQKLEMTIKISAGIIQTLIWILIAYVLVRYVQDVFYIERQYRYIDELEMEISKKLGEVNEEIFGREGKSYLKDYPIVLNLIDLFYKMLAPILFTAINVVHITEEWSHEAIKLTLVCDTIICVATITITWFYFFAIHEKITGWFMKCSVIRGASTILHRWLKEV